MCLRFEEDVRSRDDLDIVPHHWHQQQVVVVSVVVDDDTAVRLDQMLSSHRRGPTRRVDRVPLLGIVDESLWPAPVDRLLVYNATKKSYAHKCNRLV